MFPDGQIYTVAEGQRTAGNQKSSLQLSAEAIYMKNNENCFVFNKEKVIFDLYYNPHNPYERTF